MYVYLRVSDRMLDISTFSMYGNNLVLLEASKLENSQIERICLQGIRVEVHILLRNKACCLLTTIFYLNSVFDSFIRLHRVPRLLPSTY